MPLARGLRRARGCLTVCARPELMNLTGDTEEERLRLVMRRILYDPSTDEGRTRQVSSVLVARQRRPHSDAPTAPNARRHTPR